jgi:hypothetical protein
VAVKGIPEVPQNGTSSRQAEADATDRLVELVLGPVNLSP